MSYDVIGIGSALLDLIVEVDYSFLDKFSLKKGGMVLIDEDKCNEILKVVERMDYVNSSGGSSSNVMIGVSKLGGSSCFIGKVSKDESGDLYEDLIIGNGVKPKLSRTNKRTGTAITFITPDNERSFATYLGAALELREEDVSFEIIKKAKILHIEAYQLECENVDKVCLRAMHVAKENNVMISIDLSDANLIIRNLDLFKKIINDYADIVFANEDEAKAFTGLEDEEAALNKISENCKIAVVKLGEKGSLIKKNGEIYKIPINKVKEVNTTGAGDAYAAGILFSIAKNISMEKAGKLAAYIASRVVARAESTVQETQKEAVTRIIGLNII